MTREHLRAAFVASEGLPFSDGTLGIPTIVIANGELGRQDRNDQSHDRIESFIELPRMDRS